MRELEQGSGKVQHHDTVTRLLRPEATLQQYSNAQLDDYSPHQAPVTLTLRARFSHNADRLKGTAGFGFWNAPFAPGSTRLRFPKTAWFFFGSPPLNLPLAMDVPGNGFKMATLDATHWQFFTLLPTAPIGFLLTRHPKLYRLLWSIGQRAIRASEAPLNLDMRELHEYQVDWQRDQVRFVVDGNLLHTSPYSPTGQMGIVIWIDNQYAIATPQGKFGWGLVTADEPQWLEIQELRIGSSIE